MYTIVVVLCMVSKAIKNAETDCEMHFSDFIHSLTLTSVTTIGCTSAQRIRTVTIALQATVHIMYRAGWWYNSVMLTGVHVKLIKKV